jgi:hypothetical protein
MATKLPFTEKILDYSPERNVEILKLNLLALII